MNGLDLPRSVISYMTDSATRAGVDALLAVKASELPPELEWKEYEDYLSARALAELTKAEFVLALYRIWSAVWKPVIPDAWRLPEPDELLDAEQSISTGTVWEEKAYFVIHRHQKFDLHTLVGFDRRALVLAFSLERGRKILVKGGAEGFVWRDDEGWPGWMLLSPGLKPDGEGQEILRKLQAAARTAIAAVNATPELS